MSIHTSGLTKRFNGHLAVDRLNIEIDQGEVFGFLGPNGAGKTTTVRMLTSLIAPSSGTASVLNYKIGEQDREIRRNVGILTETPGLYTRLSANRNLNIFAHLYEIENPSRQVSKYLQWLGLWDRKNDPVGTFSKGMRQKLAIARALLHEPKVLFLDEPTAGLDPSASKLVREFISELRGQGRTIFICTHNLDEADRLCDRIAVFDTQLRIVDSPDNLRKRLYGRQIVFHLSTVKSQHLVIIDSLPFVEKVEQIDNKLIISLANPEQFNPEIVRKLVENGAEIQFIGEIKHSLEDIYLRMVEK
jgi:ABC-2 type transport system ATP-binding protein